MHFRHVQYFQDAGFPIESENIFNSETVQHFDERFTIVVGGWNSVEEYYDCASCDKYLEKITVPMLFINADDDPVSPGCVAPLHSFESNHNLILVQTPLGGHVGWCQIKDPTGAAYYDNLASNYFSTLLKCKGWIQ